jgi:SAM-dependent methyltransferase
MTPGFLNESIAVTAIPHCQFCGTTGISIHKNLRDISLGTPGRWSFLQCPQCRVVWLDPRPTNGELAKLYGEGYYTHHSEPPPTGEPSPTRRLKERLLAANALARVGPLRDEGDGRFMWLDPKDRRRLLDVGCGRGEYLSRMKDLGWDVQGVEPDPVAAELARDIGISVSPGTLQEAAFPDDSFDAVTMSHVIEHLADPEALLAECNRILKPGGRLVVLTPNTDSLARKLFGRWWFAWETPRHLILFSQDVLERCVTTAGFQPRLARTTARSARQIWALSRLVKRDHSIKDPVTIPPGLRFEGLVFWVLEYLLPGRWGEEIVVLATKPAPGSS